MFVLNTAFNRVTEAAAYLAASFFIPSLFLFDSPPNEGTANASITKTSFIFIALGNAFGALSGGKRKENQYAAIFFSQIIINAKVLDSRCRY